MSFDYIAYGPGYSGAYNTRKEAEEVMQTNKRGRIYVGLNLFLHVQDAYLNAVNELDIAQKSLCTRFCVTEHREECKGKVQSSLVVPNPLDFVQMGDGIVAGDYGTCENLDECSHSPCNGAQYWLSPNWEPV